MDKSRVNEFGFSGDMEETSPNAVEEPQPVAAIEDKPKSNKSKKRD